MPSFFFCCVVLNFSSITIRDRIQNSKKKRWFEKSSPNKSKDSRKNKTSRDEKVHTEQTTGYFGSGMQTIISFENG